MSSENLWTYLVDSIHYYLWISLSTQYLGTNLLQITKSYSINAEVFIYTYAPLGACLFTDKSIAGSKTCEHNLSILFSRLGTKWDYPRNKPFFFDCSDQWYTYLYISFLDSKLNLLNNCVNCLMAWNFAYFSFVLKISVRVHVKFKILNASFQGRQDFLTCNKMFLYCTILS